MQGRVVRSEGSRTTRADQGPSHIDLDLLVVHSHRFSTGAVWDASGTEQKIRKEGGVPPPLASSIAASLSLMVRCPTPAFDTPCVPAIITAPPAVPILLRQHMHTWHTHTCARLHKHTHTCGPCPAEVAWHTPVNASFSRTRTHIRTRIKHAHARAQALAHACAPTHTHKHTLRLKRSSPLFRRRA